ncbi:ABC transporter ATP-binding protein [Pseudoroseicyclus tamaricis]|uniref:ABC transporter ATP-binding protein n=1 Tax=Pseudoroseicyclus tamaricis TaxID=2705421 RepID=A0A6B2JWW2_9RHOB|nr:ABC transporter ATP-binding protein [Pseudoroseicyclus tamaricis]NDV02708.1 ABC transporter ATP-binding protein [Pseudoroseicyclus tamaricis]
MSEASGQQVGHRVDLTTLREKIERPFDYEAPASSPPPRTPLAFIRWSLNGAGGVLLIASALSFVAGTTEVLAAYLLGSIIDSTDQTGPAQFFSDNGVLLALVAAFFVLARPIALGLNSLSQTVMMAPNIFNLVLGRLFRYTLGHSVNFFDNDFAGRIAQKEMQAARAVSDLANDFVNTVIFALSSFIGALAMLGLIGGWTVVALLVWLGGYLWLLIHYIPRIRKTAKDRAESRARVTGQVVDTITNIKTVKLFAHSEYEDRAALGALRRFRQDQLAFGHVSTSFRFWLMTLAGTLPVLLVGIPLYLWSQGQASTGQIVAAGAIALRLAQMTGWVSFTLMQMYSNLGEVEDAVDTLTPEWRLQDAPDAVELEPAREILFDDVTYTYGGGSGGIRDLTLRIAPGEKVGVVGASGAGKSTLVALLLRLYDAEEGAIRVGGQDISKVTQESLRKQIGMVTQETSMFNRTARENIGYGRPEASQAEIEDAAARAEAHDFIGELRDFRGRQGYDAFLGERGVKLSGGQRQRISLARALLKDAPILVLDEATSALDSEVEAQILEALEEAMEGKTVLAIAHRLSTLSSMDRIVVMHDGRIVEEGTHHDLLAQDGLYARYWKRQSGGFIGTDGGQEAAE